MPDISENKTGLSVFGAKVKEWQARQREFIKDYNKNADEEKGLKLFRQYEKENINYRHEKPNVDFLSKTSHTDDYSFNKLKFENKQAILKYLGSDSYPLNEKLYRELELNQEDKFFIDKLDEALNNIPTVKNQDLVRDMMFDSQEDEDAFVNKAFKDLRFEFKSYTSTTVEEEYNSSANVRIQILDANKAHNLIDVNLLEHEALYKRGAKFKILTWIYKRDKIVFMVMEE